jgi:hypothetical protein
MSEQAEINLPNNSWWDKVDLERDEDKKRTREIEQKKREYEERQRERQRRDEERRPALI